MKLQKARESAQIRPRAKEVLEPLSEQLPYDEVLALIEECRPALLRQIERHREKVTMFTLGREVMDILPELKTEYAPTEKDWDQYFKLRWGFGSTDSGRAYMAGMVALFPDHRKKIEVALMHVLDPLGGSANGGGSYSFLIAQALSWIRPSSGWRWTQLMEQQWVQAFKELQEEPNLPAQIYNLAHLLLYKADLRPEIQAMVISKMPAVKAYVHQQLETQSDQNLPDVLWALKIIFSTSVVVDEFGRLTLEEGERAGMGKRAELPLRPAV